jgi:hypothetical protein
MNVIRLVSILSLTITLNAVSTAAQTTAAPKPKPPKPQISAPTREKAAETNTNPDALVLADFQKRIDAYMAIHKDAAKESLPIKETNNPAEIKTAQETLGARIRAARVNAKAGDIMTPEIRNKFRRLMYPVVEGTNGREIKENLKEDVKEKDEAPPKKVVLKVNATYPEGNPLPTTPPQVLMNLPKLPEELEYRVIDKNLIIRDVQANIIVDFVPGAIQ